MVDESGTSELPTERPEDASADEAPRAIAGLTDELVAAAVAGDRAAIGVLFAVLNPRLTRYLGLMVGREADDIASETWVEVIRSLPRYVGGAATIGAWVIGIGRNRALGHFRRQRSRPQTVAGVDDFAEILAGEADTAQTVADRLASAEALARIARLPKEQAEAVFLRTIVGLDAAGAGQVLDKTPGAVRTSAHRGLRSLRDQIESEREAEREGERDGGAADAIPPRDARRGGDRSPGRRAGPSRRSG